MCDDETLLKPTIRLNPAAPNRATRHGARNSWAQGLLAGLPFVEIVLLAVFLASAGMVLKVEPRHETKAQTIPHHPVYRP